MFMETITSKKYVTQEWTTTKKMSCSFTGRVSRFKIKYILDYCEFKTFESIVMFFPLSFFFSLHIFYSKVIGIWATWRTFQPQLPNSVSQKRKKNLPWKNFLYFSKTKLSYIFGWSFPDLSPKSKKTHSENISYIFSKLTFSYISEWMLTKHRIKSFLTPYDKCW